MLTPWGVYLAIVGVLVVAAVVGLAVGLARAARTWNDCDEPDKGVTIDLRTSRKVER